jgi:hypothetical protein
MDYEDAARHLAHRVPQLGAVIASVEIAAGSPIAVEQTTPDPRHYTVWGDAAELLAEVRSVVPV